MQPVEFPQMTTTWAKNQPPYLPLPAYTDGEQTITLWALTWRERLVVLFRGRVWLTQLNFGFALQPQRPSVESPFVDSTESAVFRRSDVMRIGTKSVLFGVHQFLLHPLLIALGWWKEYGWRRVAIGAGVTTHLLDPRLWLAFIVHDLGYLGKPNMDGEEGETHPEFGSRVMRRLFGEVWGGFVLLHSRYYAKRLGLPVSALAMADKWVIVLEPSWLYLPRAWASGELAEYLEVGARRADAWQPTDAVTRDEAMGLGSRRPLAWHRAVKAYMRRWIAEHRDGRQDTWTRRRHATAQEKGHA
ncbi:MAG: hypothetical protein Q8K55_11390 [Gemmatimonadaceae bacterium]|nr:hypothetical protein [Gemmatimonadaceae bacterium]